MRVLNTKPNICVVFRLTEDAHKIIKEYAKHHQRNRFKVEEEVFDKLRKLKYIQSEQYYDVRKWTHGTVIGLDLDTDNFHVASARTYEVETNIRNIFEHYVIKKGKS